MRDNKYDHIEQEISMMYEMNPGKYGMDKLSMSGVGDYSNDYP